jgi:hypothetical protein
MQAETRQAALTAATALRELAATKDPDIHAMAGHLEERRQATR